VDRYLPKRHGAIDDRCRWSVVEYITFITPLTSVMLVRKLLRRYRPHVPRRVRLTSSLQRNGPAAARGTNRSTSSMANPDAVPPPRPFDVGAEECVLLGDVVADTSSVRPASRAPVYYGFNRDHHEDSRQTLALAGNAISSIERGRPYVWLPVTDERNQNLRSIIKLKPKKRGCDGVGLGEHRRI